MQAVLTERPICRAKVDGLPEEAQVAMVNLLREITKAGFVYPDYIYK